ncbi:MAG TPA: GspE/PulE family protein [Gemmatimonadaceae bacterium]|nr:GspE/PulE family protein [Gemmatimonadaceae bacterium]
MTPRPLTLGDGLTRDYLLHHRVCPIDFTESGAVRVSAAPDALLDDALDDLRFVYGAEVIVEPASLGDVERAIERLTTRAGRDIELARVDHDDERTADVRDLATQPPVVRFVNLLVRDAYDAGASDIHLESARSGLNARFRLDGVLAPAPEPPAELAHAVVSRIKLLAELDIAERRRPQDGRIRVRLEDRELDLRVSTVPTLFGESVVLRLLDRGGRPVALEELGMPAGILASVSRLAARPHGMILVTGPTGSGKTTTLYSALQRRDTKAEKIITVEDPVEYELPGITQVPVHRQAGVTFATALRSILRQDPDVVMLGEMRDPETAEVAVQAAMTGHVVFSTLHTNDAVSAIPRLVDLGVPPYLIAATLDGVLAQRLVRKICDTCRGEHCPACRHTGYRGRLGLFELFRVDDEAKRAIVAGASRADLTALARANGMRTLAQDGEEKVAAGATTMAEVMRAADS